MLITAAREPLEGSDLILWKGNIDYLRREKGHLYSARFTQNTAMDNSIINQTVVSVLKIVKAKSELTFNELWTQLAHHYAGVDTLILFDELKKICKKLHEFNVINIRLNIKEACMETQVIRFSENNILDIIDFIEFSRIEKYHSLTNPFFTGQYEELLVRARLFSRFETFFALKVKNTHKALVSAFIPPDGMADSFPNVASLGLLLYKDFSDIKEILLALRDNLNQGRQYPISKIRLIARSDRVTPKTINLILQTGFEKEASLLHEFKNADLEYYTLPLN